MSWERRGSNPHSEAHNRRPPTLSSDLPPCYLSCSPSLLLSLLVAHVLTERANRALTKLYKFTVQNSLPCVHIPLLSETFVNSQLKLKNYQLIKH